MEYSSEDASRRQVVGLLAGAAAALAGVMVGTEAAAGDSNHDHHGSAPQAAPAPRRGLVDAALACVNKGEVCLNHCYALLGTGDTSLKNCVRTVSAMLPICTALARFAAQDAARLKDLAKLCIDVCGDCEAECRKHQDHHAECRACADSCADCIKACKAVVAG